MQPKSPEEKRKDALRAVALYSGMAFQLLAACLLGVFLGRKPGDRFFDFDNRAHNSKCAEMTVQAMRGVDVGAV